MAKITTLDWFLIHKPEIIPQELYEAGKILQNDWYKAFFRGFVSSVNLEHLYRVKGLAEDRLNIAEEKVEHLNKIVKALNFMKNTVLEEILVEIVCNNQRLSDFEKKKKWRKGTGGIVLSISLYKLAVFYGLIIHKNYLDSNGLH